jgi:tRNA-splicing ligase RtcB
MKAEIDKAKLWTDLETIEQSALDQIKAAAQHPRLFKHIAIMPDVHAGIGCTVGSVIPLIDAVIPAAVGVDIGCGMCAVRTNLTVDEVTPEFEKIHGGLIRRIPTGFHHRSEKQLQDVHDFADQDWLEDELKYFKGCYSPDKAIINQLGTLGGGNHFIELQKDPENNVWIMLHSGSRNIGKVISEIGIRMAKAACNDYSIKYPAPVDMEYVLIPSGEGLSYLNGMNFAQNFAMQNRLVMIHCILKELEYRFPHLKTTGEIINIHHNYVAKETHFGQEVWVHRKGATKAVPHEYGIIPGSMGTKSYIVVGKANPDSFNSCSHGAGRQMSRTAARGKLDRKSGNFKTEGILNVEDFAADMNGVYSQNINRMHLDEAPRAYKDIDVVMANQTDLVDIEVELTPIFNMKG